MPEIQSQRNFRQQDQHGNGCTGIADGVGTGDSGNTVKRNFEGAKNYKIIQQSIDAVHPKRNADGDFWPSTAFENSG